MTNCILELHPHTWVWQTAFEVTSSSTTNSNGENTNSCLKQLCCPSNQSQTSSDLPKPPLQSFSASCKRGPQKPPCTPHTWSLIHLWALTISPFRVCNINILHSWTEGSEKTPISRAGVNHQTKLKSYSPEAPLFTSLTYYNQNTKQRQECSLDLMWGVNVTPIRFYETASSTRS